MTRALLLNWNPEQWAPALRAAAPGLAVRTMSDVVDPAQVDVLLTWKLPPGLLDALPNLRLLYAVGAGVDNLVDEVRQRPHLQLARIVDDAVSGDVATLAVAGTLQWLRDLAPYARQQEQRLWQPLAHRSTADVTIGVLGLGRIGLAAARAFQALGFGVCGWARSPKRAPGIESFHGVDGLRAMAACSRVLVCTLPLTPQTAHVIDHDLLSCLPFGAFLVNVGRGRHVDERALLAALDSGRVSGAFLDVFEAEPLPADHPFWSHPAVRITPHVASRTPPQRVAQQVVENVRRLRAGEPLLNLVNPSAGY